MRFFFALLLVIQIFSCEMARASYLMYALPSLQTVTQRSIQVLAPNNLRAALEIINAGPSTAYVQFGTISQYSINQQIAYQGIPVISGQTIRMYPAPGNACWADSPGTANMTFIQGQ